MKLITTFLILTMSLLLTSCSSIPLRESATFENKPYEAIYSFAEKQTKEEGYARIWYIGTKEKKHYIVITVVPKPIALTPLILLRSERHLFSTDQNQIELELKELEYDRETWILHDDVFGSEYRERLQKLEFQPVERGQ